MSNCTEVLPDSESLYEKGKVQIEFWKDKFLQFNNSACTIPGDKPYLVSNVRCLLRYGVENSSNQSFLSCIADVFNKEILKKQNLSINEFKTILLTIINIDNYITFNNGNLVEIFMSKNIDNEFLNNITINEIYKKTNLYQQIDSGNFNQINTFKKIINSYENFYKYIKDTKYTIDHTYLWDIICKPHPKLFPKGINLIILDITTNTSPHSLDCNNS